MVVDLRGRTGIAWRPSSSSDLPRFHDSFGTSLAEMVIVLAIISCVLGVGLPMLANNADAKRTRDAAAFLAGQFRLARQRAVMTGHHVAVVFDDVEGEDGWRLCEDGNRDGLSRDDVDAGVDRCEASAQPLSHRFSRVRIGYIAGVPSPDGEVGPSPLRFGTARMAVFTPTGTASSGTVAVSGQGQNQFAVRVSGVTGRTRVLRFDPGRGVWSE